jgi:ferredoxin
VKVSVDPVLCRASAYCVQAAPQIFALNESGDCAEVIDTSELVEGEERTALVRDAEAQCPMGAIILSE